jgi:hypothetical protein
MTVENAKEFAGYINEALHRKQNVLTPGNGILIEDSTISLGVFVLCEQPIIYDDTCFGKTLLVLKNNELQMALPLDESGSTSLYIGTPGTYTYMIELLPGIPQFQLSKTYSSTGKYDPINISITPPVKAPMYPFATATDEQLANMINSYYLGLYSVEEENDLKTLYLPVGAKRSIHLDHMDAGDGCNEEHFGPEGADYDFIIIGQDHDDLVEQFGTKTKALITLHQERILYKNLTDERYFYGSGYDEKGKYYYGYPNFTDGGGYIHYQSEYSPYVTYETCNRRQWCNNTYVNALPFNLKRIVKTVSKPTLLYNGNTFNLKNLNEKAFLLSEYEVWGEKRYRQEAQEGEVYEYYRTTSEDKSNWKRLNKKPVYNSSSPDNPNPESYDYSSAYWYLRSQAYSSDWCTVYGYGGGKPDESIPNYTSYSLYYCLGIAPGFCL